MLCRLLPLVLALCCFAVACGDDDAAPADASLDATRDAEVAAAIVDAWCPMLAARQCEASITTCGCGDVPGFGDVTACRTRVERACREQLGRFTGDPAFELASEIPAACFDALDEAFGACDLPPADLFTVRCPLVWPSALSRTLPSEGACVEGLCAEGTRCGSEGTCAVPSAGGACGSVGDCPAEQRCGDEGTCRPLATEGAGASCSGPDACAGDLRCLAATRRECAPRDPGGSCVSDDACASGEYCADGTCTTAPGEGEACGNGVACATSLACAFMPGPDEGTCQPLPENGEACALGPMGPFVCAAGLACRDRFCGAIPGEGEDCAVGDVRCADGLGCAVEGERSVCRVRGGVGAACMLDDSCEAGTYCDFSQNECATYLADGEVCRAGNECGPDGSCVPDDTATTFRCVRRPGEGEACFLDDSCQPGLVCRSPFDAGVCAPPICAAVVF